jgi:hypothetical protein
MKFRCLSFGVSLVVVPLSAALAQARRPCPVPDGAVLLACHADVPPVPALDRKLPRYPDILRQAGVEDEVHVQYVVDTTGRVIPGTLVIVASKYDHFTSMVRGALPAWTFVPAMRAGARVAVVYEEFFVFRDKPGGLPGADIVAVRDTTTDGIPRTTLGPAARDSLAATAYSLEDLTEAQRSVLLVLAGKVSSRQQPGQAPTICVGIMQDGIEVPADSETLRRLEAPQRRAVAKRDCPPSYARMWAMVDSLGRVVDPRPPGWIDPYHLTVRRIEPWSRVSVLIHGDVGHGMGGFHYRCGARREGGVWSATCDVTAAWVH